MALRPSSRPGSTARQDSSRAGKTRAAAGPEDLERYLEIMKREGITDLEWAGHRIRLPRPPSKRDEVLSKLLGSQPRCACTHPLRRHGPDGSCLWRDPRTGAPCEGKCQRIDPDPGGLPGPGRGLEASARKAGEGPVKPAVALPGPGGTK